MKRTNTNTRPFILGSSLCEVFADRSGSYRIVDKYDQTVALVKCNREDPQDNARGLAIAEFIASAMNQKVAPKTEIITRAPKTEIITRAPKTEEAPKSFGPGDYILMGDRYISWEKYMSE